MFSKQDKAYITYFLSLLK